MQSKLNLIKVLFDNSCFSGSKTMEAKMFGCVSKYFGRNFSLCP